MENGQIDSTRQKAYSSSDKHSVQLWWTEKQLRMHDMLDFEVDELHQQKIMLDPTFASQEEKAEDALNTGSPSLV